MALTKIQWQLRYPYASNPDGYYYWTNAYFADIPDPSDFPSYIPAIEDVLFRVNLLETEVNWVRVQSPPEAEPPLLDAYAFNHGGESAVSGPTIVENVVRVRLFVGGDYAGYRMLRGVVPTSYLADDRIDPGLLAYIQSNYADALIANGQTTRAGVPLTSAVVSPRIHHWQLRHGTKRRQRGVLHTP